MGDLSGDGIVVSPSSPIVEELDFLSRLPLPPTVEDILGSSTLTDPDDLGFYLIRASGYIMPFFPIPGVGLGGLVPSPNPITGTGSNGFFPLPTLVLGGLPLTNDDFQTQRVPMPTLHITGHTTRPFAAPTEEPRLSYAINNQNDTSRSYCARHTQREAVILAGNTHLRPDYCTAACSGFATSAAPAPPSKAPFQSSPPPRSTLLGSAILLGHHAFPRPTPAPNLQLDHSPPAAPPALQTTAAPGNDASAAAEHLSNILLRYSHRDWEQAQRVDPLYDATRRYIQLGCPNPPSPTLCDHLSSHTRPETANIFDFAAEGRLCREMMKPSYSFGNL